MNGSEEEASSFVMDANGSKCDSNCFGYNELESIQCKIERDSAICKVALKAAPDTTYLNKITKDKQSMTSNWLLEIDYKKDQGLDYVAGFEYQSDTTGATQVIMPFERTSPQLKEDVKIGDNQDGPLRMDNQLINSTLTIKVIRANCISLVTLFKNSNVYFSTYTEEGSHGQTILYLLK